MLFHDPSCLETQLTRRLTNYSRPETPSVPHTLLWKARGLWSMITWMMQEQGGSGGRSFNRNSPLSFSGPSAPRPPPPAPPPPFPPEPNPPEPLSSPRGPPPPYPGWPHRSLTDHTSPPSDTLPFRSFNNLRTINPLKHHNP